MSLKSKLHRNNKHKRTLVYNIKGQEEGTPVGDEEKKSHHQNFHA